jgi:hypothetical protein
MADHDGGRVQGQVAFDHVEIGSAQAARDYPNEDLVFVGNGTIDFCDSNRAIFDRRLVGQDCGAHDIVGADLPSV